MLRIRLLLILGGLVLPLFLNVRSLEKKSVKLVVTLGGILAFAGVVAVIGVKICKAFAGRI